jgi:hypothetical protein
MTSSSRLAKPIRCCRRNSNARSPSPASGKRSWSLRCHGNSTAACHCRRSRKSWAMICLLEDPEVVVAEPVAAIAAEEREPVWHGAGPAQGGVSGRSGAALVTAACSCRPEGRRQRRRKQRSFLWASIASGVGAAGAESMVDSARDAERSCRRCRCRRWHGGGWIRTRRFRPGIRQRHGRKWRKWTSRRWPRGHSEWRRSCRQRWWRLWTTRRRWWLAGAPGCDVVRRIASRGQWQRRQFSRRNVWTKCWSTDGRSGCGLQSVRQHPQQWPNWQGSPGSGRGSSAVPWFGQRLSRLGQNRGSNWGLPARGRTSPESRDQFTSSCFPIGSCSCRRR